MSARVLPLVALCGWSVLLSGCASAPVPYMGFERQDEPGVRDFQLSIAEDGSYRYAPAEGAVRRGTLSAEKMDRLVRAFNSSSFTGLGPWYGCKQGGEGEDCDGGHGHAGGAPPEPWTGGRITYIYGGKRVVVEGCSPMLLLPIGRLLENYSNEIGAAQ